MSDRQRPEVGVTPTEPYDAAEVRRRARQHLAANTWFTSGHARKRMAECSMSLVDVANLLRGGHLAAGKGCSFENGTWRYRIESSQMAVVVAFTDDERMVLVTAFRLT